MISLAQANWLFASSSFSPTRMPLQWTKLSSLVPASHIETRALSARRTSLCITIVSPRNFGMSIFFLQL